MSRLRAADVPLVEIDDLPDGAWEPERISSTRSALGIEPVRLLYLWVFERPDDLRVQLIGHGWTLVGPVHLLLSLGARVPGKIVRNRAQMRRAVAHFRDAPGTYRPPKLADFTVHASYHGYPINYLWCADNIWQEGFRRLAGHCALFVVDLSADERADSLRWELDQLFASTPAERILLLVDSWRADLDLARELVAESWSGLAASSVNHRRRRRPPDLLAYRTTSPAYMLRATLAAWTGKAKVPIARRAAHHARLA